MDGWSGRKIIPLRGPFVSRLPYFVVLPFYDYLLSWCLSFVFFRGNPVIKLIVPGGWMDGWSGRKIIPTINLVPH